MTEEGLFKKEGYDPMAAAFEVYNELGHGFLEDVYQAGLERELRSRGLRFERKPAVQILYKGEPLDKEYFPDLLVSGGVIAELKAVQALAREHEAQLLNYLKATKKRVGYLINFGCSTKLEWKRMVL